MSKVVIFAGSGLSKSLANIPVQNEYLPAVLNKDRREWVLSPLPIEERETLEKWNDIEMLLSYLYYQDMINKSHCEDRFYKRAIINFRMAQNVYLNDFNIDSKDIKRNTDCKKSRKAFKHLIEQACSLSNNQCSIITTNYDLCIETILNGDYSYCLTEQDDEKKIKLLKLHGSINWLEERIKKLNGELTGKYSGAELLHHVKSNLDLIKSGKKRKHKRDTKFNNYTYNYRKKYYTPITIPFFFQKYDWYTERWKCIFKERIWQLAEQELMSADYIFFIGWGIAPADYPILALLYKAKFWDKKSIIINRNANKYTDLGIKFHCCTARYLQDFEEGEFGKWLNCVLEGAYGSCKEL